MTMITNYRQFDGVRPETGPLRNILAHQSLPTPHTGKPISEALLLGVSGGIAVGYFIFEYKGYLPHIALLTHNTFDPLDTVFERLALPREVLQTSKPETALKNLMDVLESGHPAMVWADMFSLPYNLLPPNEPMWAMNPLVVYGVEGNNVYIADRSCQPLTVSLDDFTKARARVKQEKFRVLDLDAPDMDKLPAAVQKGIWQCISLFTDAPPKGTRENFGFAALQHWANMLTNTRNKHSWERYFAPGSRLYAALAGDIWQPGIFDWIHLWSGVDGAERALYADFLDEAAVILAKPALTSVADQFRRSAAVWSNLANAVLPDDLPLLKETRELKLRRRALFLQQPISALDERKAINARLRALKESAATDFSLTTTEFTALRENLREHVLTIHDLEHEAINALQSAMT